MLRNAIAPTSAFTQIANAHIWDDGMSDAAFRLLVRALALSDAAARKTTVTELAAGLTGGRITADRARRQLAKKGLLHTTKWRNAAGQVRSESLVSSVPLDAEEAEGIFVGRRGVGGAGGVGRTRALKVERADVSVLGSALCAAGVAGGPSAGSRKVGPADVPSPGTLLPSEGTLGEKTSSPLPVPPVPPVPPDADGRLAAAERVLLSLRQVDAQLVLGSAEAARLAPLAAEWLARGVSVAGLRHALTSALPVPVKAPAALVRHRLREKMPEDAADQVPLKLAMCGDCGRGFRVVADEARCAQCRTAAPVRPPEPAPVRMGWRERVRLAGADG
ncbi:hypothetical protein LN042_30035 [Kitasatospora sp. RB6PN24]|uniref:hypothetical protein n=1 Tax=Kitasatospora humi TaxID=2893891 RepID=UPI001E3D9630|nr:hypothetical protein [Kitasatospora humi]MCC9311250.1 hypothetical protein [Kitasatospora humi]